MDRNTKYYELADNAGHLTHIKTEVYYNLGGMNYFTGKAEKRGYYASASPVEKREHSESYVGFTGLKMLVKEVGRKSKKAEAEAVKEADDVMGSLVDQVLQKNSLQLKEEINI